MSRRGSSNERREPDSVGAPRRQGKGRSEPRGGREAVTQRILDVAEEKLSARPYAKVSMREIADAAGVSHALVHRYVGSKQDLLTEIISRTERHLIETTATAPSDDLRGALGAMWNDDPERLYRYMRLIVRTALSGMPLLDSYEHFPATRFLAEVAERQTSAEPVRSGALPPRLVVAGCVALLLTWTSIGPWLFDAAGIDEWSEEELHAGAESLVVTLIDAAIPSDDTPDPDAAASDRTDGVTSEEPGLRPDQAGSVET